MPRTLYHTSIKYLAYEGLLAPEIVFQIPRSNIHRWKRQSPERYQSFKLDVSDYELLREFNKQKKAQAVFRAYVRLIKTLVDIAHKCSSFHRVIKEQSNRIVQIIQRSIGMIGIHRCLRMFNISLATFRNWSAQSMTSCFHSVINTCNKVYPNQLSKPQVLTLKSILEDHQYVRKLGINRHRPDPRRKHRHESIRAMRSNEVWHADITSFVTIDNTRHYIYLVVDNFSRKILACEVHDRVRNAIRMETIRTALQHLGDKSGVPVLVTDSGPENNFVALTDTIEHKRALVDVRFSNSLIEAHNKLIKYNYLYRMHIPDGQHLAKVMDQIVTDFNNRPHVSLNGLTPSEAYEGIDLYPEILRLNVQRSMVDRRVHNKINRCGQCEGK